MLALVPRLNLKGTHFARAWHPWLTAQLARAEIDREGSTLLEDPSGLCSYRPGSRPCSYRFGNRFACSFQAELENKRVNR